VGGERVGPRADELLQIVSREAAAPTRSNMLESRSLTGSDCIRAEAVDSCFDAFSSRLKTL
jgi:hypothetical protein